MALVGAVGLLVGRSFSPLECPVPVSGIRTYHRGNSTEPPERAVHKWAVPSCLRKAMGLLSL